MPAQVVYLNSYHYNKKFQGCKSCDLRAFEAELKPAINPRGFAIRALRLSILMG